MSAKHSHYHKDVAHLKSIDVYRVIKLFNVTDPCIQHALKKLLVPGGRGAGKTQEQDVREAVDSLNRCLQMIAEDCNATVTGDGTGTALPPITDNATIMPLTGKLEGAAVAQGQDLTVAELSISRSRMPLVQTTP